MDSDSTLRHKFTCEEALDILNTAHLSVAEHYADTPDLVSALQYQLKNGIDLCYDRSKDVTETLNQQLRGERIVLDAYNRHRLGKADHLLNHPNVILKPEDAVTYDEADNVPQLLELFPLHHELFKRGCDVDLPNIYQVSGTMEHLEEWRTKAARRPVDKSAPSTKKTGRGTLPYDKFADAPDARMAFPNGNMTMVEILVFLPQSVKSCDIVNRFLWNGAFTTTFAAIINMCREMPNGPVSNNSIYRMMKNSMNQRAQEDEVYADWSVTKHQTIPKPNGYDPTSVSISGFREYARQDKRRGDKAFDGPSPGIYFRDLAKGVKIMPSSVDALDLTRCVEYAVSNPHEDWLYPYDFERLVDRIGGPAVVRQAHYDASVVARYSSAFRLDGARNVMQRDRDFHGRLQKKQDESASSSGASTIIVDPDFEIEADVTNGKAHGRNRLPRADATSAGESQSASTVSRPRKNARKSRRSDISELPEEDALLGCDSDSDSDESRGPATKRQSGPIRRRSSRVSRINVNCDVEAAFNIDETENETDEDMEDEIDK